MSLAINFERGFINKGNFDRIACAMKKAMRGDKITVAFLGGSITQGSLSTTPEKCYAYLVYKWWKEKFPNTEVVYVNAGIGGTPSDFGVARVDKDALSYSPDFLIAEFSVNDAPTDYYMESYEGLIRHILKTSPKTGLMLLHNVRYDNMSSAEDKHVIVGKYYDIPEVSLKYCVYPEVANGNIKNRDITPDDLHPNDAGHRLVADAVIYALEIIFEYALHEDVKAENMPVPKPLTLNTLENSVRLQNNTYKAKAEGFTEDTRPQKHITEMFRCGYEAWKKNDSITFIAKSESILVQYRKSVKKPTPIAKAVVDGDEKNAVILDGNFEEDWGDCLYTVPVLLHGKKTEHEVKITIIEDHASKGEKDEVPFYLVSVIAGNK